MNLHNELRKKAILSGAPQNTNTPLGKMLEDIQNLKLS